MSDAAEKSPEEGDAGAQRWYRPSGGRSFLFTSLKQTVACLSDVVGEELGGEYHHLCTLGYERAAGSEFSDQKKFEATF